MLFARFAIAKSHLILKWRLTGPWNTAPERILFAMSEASASEVFELSVVRVVTTSCSEFGVRCPVLTYEVFQSREPAKMLETGKAFYVATNNMRRPQNPVWYSAAPLGHNSISKLMKMAGIRAGIPRNLTNHVVRKTSITTLVQAGMPYGMIAQHSGHCTVDSIKHYATASVGQQKVMSSILSHQPGTSDKVDSVVALPCARPAIAAAAGSSRDLVPLNMPASVNPPPPCPIESAENPLNQLFPESAAESSEVNLTQLSATQPYSHGKALIPLPMSQNHPFSSVAEDADPLGLEDMEHLSLSQVPRNEGKFLSVSGKKEVGNVLKGMFSPNAYVKDNTFNFTINFNSN